MEQLIEDYHRIRMSVMAKFQTADHLQKEIIAKDFKDLIKLEKVIDKYHIEEEFLHLSNKISSNKLLKLQATMAVEIEKWNNRVNPMG